MFGHMSIKEKVLRNTHIRSMHELGETKKARDFRADEVSVQRIIEKNKRQFNSSLPNCIK